MKQISLVCAELGLHCRHSEPKLLLPQYHRKNPNVFKGNCSDKLFGFKQILQVLKMAIMMIFTIAVPMPRNNDGFNKPFAVLLEMSRLMINRYTT